MPFDNTPTRIDTDASLLIERARALIDRPEKWRKSGQGHGRKCALGALWSVNKGGGYPYTVAAEALNAIAREHGHWRIWNLNDHPSTTHADIMAVMREAADLARSEQ